MIESQDLDKMICEWHRECRTKRCNAKIAHWENEHCCGAGCLGKFCIPVKQDKQKEGGNG